MKGAVCHCMARACFGVTAALIWAAILLGDEEEMAVSLACTRLEGPFYDTFCQQNHHLRMQHGHLMRARFRSLRWRMGCRPPSLVMRKKWL